MNLDFKINGHDKASQRIWMMENNVYCLNFTMLISYVLYTILHAL